MSLLGRLWLPLIRFLLCFMFICRQASSEIPSDLFYGPLVAQECVFKFLRIRALSSIPSALRFLFHLTASGEDN